MDYRTIAVVVTDLAADAPVIESAVTLASDLEAHLDIHCIGIDTSRYEPLPAASAAILVEAGLAEAQARAAELKEWVLTKVPRDMAKVSIEAVVMPHLGIDQGIARLVRYADLVIGAKPYVEGTGPVQVAVLEAELFTGVVPTLVVGEGMTDQVRAPKRILFAWDESDVALRALRLALPYLKQADRVDVVMVAPPSHSPERSDPGGAVSLLMARHGVQPEVTILSKSLPTVAECLLRFAKEHESDMIVMGGYGHSRLREALLGGATRDLLQQAPVPLLMAH